MKCNIGGVDRKLRIVLGLAIIAAGIYFQSWWGAIGVMALLTGSQPISQLACQRKMAVVMLKRNLH
jgi:type IV secretory pathway TrbD component